MKTVLSLAAALALGLGLAWVVGQCLPANMLPLVLGLAAGLALSVPTSLLVVGLVARAHEAATRVLPCAAPPPAPAPIIIIRPAESDLDDHV